MIEWRKGFWNGMAMGAAQLLLISSVSVNDWPVPRWLSIVLGLPVAVFFCWRYIRGRRRRAVDRLRDCCVHDESCAYWDEEKTDG